MIIDTHCHYNLEPLDGADNAWKAHWVMAQENDVSHSLVVGTSAETSHRAVQIAEAEPALLAAIGIHPSEYQELLEANPTASVTTELEQQFLQLRALASSPQVVAIGETGLDYFRLPENPDLANQVKLAQQQAFIQHLALAIEQNLPLVIHVRDTTVPEVKTAGNAYWDVLEILTQQTKLPPFILHCISGPIAYLEAALALGAFIGVAGNVTYKNADHIRSLVKLTPPSQLLQETDAPFLPPQPHRGQPCQPWMVRVTTEFLESELNLDRQLLAQNAQRLFPRFK